MMLKLLKSNTVQIVLLTFVINGLQALQTINPPLSPEMQIAINAILAILAIIARMRQKQDFNEPEIPEIPEDPEETKAT